MTLLENMLRPILIKTFSLSVSMSVLLISNANGQYLKSQKAEGIVDITGQYMYGFEPANFDFQYSNPIPVGWYKSKQKNGSYLEFKNIIIDGNKSSWYVFKIAVKYPKATTYESAIIKNLHFPYLKKETLDRFKESLIYENISTRKTYISNILDYIPTEDVYQLFLMTSLTDDLRLLAIKSEPTLEIKQVQAPAIVINTLSKFRIGGLINEDMDFTREKAIGYLLSERVVTDLGQDIDINSNYKYDYVLGDLVFTINNLPLNEFEFTDLSENQVYNAIQPNTSYTTKNTTLKREPKVNHISTMDIFAGLAALTAGALIVDALSNNNEPTKENRAASSPCKPGYCEIKTMYGLKGYKCIRSGEKWYDPASGYYIECK